MARIRIVDEWLRSPVSSPARQRAIMVVARSWAEQRVLMRAFSTCDDQTRPTIELKGVHLAIGPAGTDPHGEWGIHVEPPVDGRAQELRVALQEAARLLAGSKGNPPRLQDELPEFDDKATSLFVGAGAEGGAPKEMYEPAEGAPMSQSKEIPSSAKAAQGRELAKARAEFARQRMRKTPPFWNNSYSAQEEMQEEPKADLRGRKTLSFGSNSHSHGQLSQNNAGGQLGWSATATRRSRQNSATTSSGGTNSQARAAQQGASSGKSGRAAKTVFGFSGAKEDTETYSKTASKTMPLGFRLSPDERQLLNALGESPFLSAGQIGQLLNLPDPMTWMAAFMDKLAELGLDLVAPGDDLDGEATYILLR